MYASKLRKLLIATMALLLVLSIAATALAAYETIPYGEESHRVRQLQTALKNKGYYKGSVDGKFGPGTKSAVSKYQAAIGLKSDGKPGNRTLTALYEGLSAANAVSTSTKQTIVQPKSPSTLAYGQTNQRVRSVQNALKVLGLYKGAVDGKFGDMTLDAVRAFQHAMGIRADGLVGSKTIALLNAKQNKVNVGTGVLLSLGSEGQMVTMVQDYLKADGYYTGGDAPGTFSGNTMAAVMAYQKDHDLEASGAVSQSLYNKITVRLPASASGSTKTYHTLRPGMDNVSVRELKDALIQLKFLDSPAQSSNIYDPDTVVAVKAFQTAYGLKVDGLAGNETLSKLYALAPQP